MFAIAPRVRPFFWRFNVKVFEEGDNVLFMDLDPDKPRELSQKKSRAMPTRELPLKTQ